MKGRGCVTLGVIAVILSVLVPMFRDKVTPTSTWQQGNVMHLPSGLVGWGTVVLVLILGVIALRFFRSAEMNPTQIDTTIDYHVIAYNKETGAYQVLAPSTMAITGADGYVQGINGNLWYWKYDVASDMNVYIFDPQHKFDSPGGRNDVAHKAPKLHWKHATKIGG